MMDVWFVILLVCLLSLPISLVALIFSRFRQKAKWAAIASPIGVIVSFVAFGLTYDAQRAHTTINEKARHIAGPEIDGHPEYSSDEAKRNILDKKITLGMTPHEARLAGGGCFYKVQADPERWLPGSDPLVVMARQANHPDDSKITLTFRNATQFQTPEPVTFRVEIRRGRVTEIVALDKR